MHQFVSRLFEPIVVLPVTMLVLVRSFAGLTSRGETLFYAFFIAGLLLPIVFFRLWLLKRRGVAWDIPKRTDRVVPMMILAMFFGMGYVAVQLWGSAFLNTLFLFLFVWFLGFVAITFRYKISGHVATDTFATLLLVRHLGIAWWPILLVVPLVAWARVVGKHHTVGQVIAGAAYSLVLFWFYEARQGIL